LVDATPPLELLPVEGAQVLGNEPATHDLRNVDRLPSRGVDANGRDEVFGQANPVAIDGLERRPPKRAVRADGHARTVAVQTHLPGTVERVRLLGSAGCSEGSTLVVVCLRDLNESDPFVVEVSQYAVE